MHGYRIPHKTKKVIHNNARENLGFPFVFFFFLLQASDLQVDVIELRCEVVELLVPRRSNVEEGGVSPATHFLLEEMTFL